MGRAPCCEKVGVKRGRWTREEDGILARYIEEHGAGAWRSLPKDAGLLRCGKSCRLRWINYLRADLKRGNISSEEEEMIIKLHATLGNRWSLIAGHMPGRTDNEIKNHWNSHLSRRARHDGGVVVDVDLSKLPGGGKRRGGRASSRGNAAAATKPATKGKGKAKKKAAAGRAKAKPAAAAAAAETEHHHRRRTEEDDEDDSKNTSHDDGISTSSGCHPSTADASRQVEEQTNHACSSGVTSDGHEEGALGLFEEMVSGLKGQSSPSLDVTLDASINVGDTEPEPPTAVVGHDEVNMELDHHQCCNESEGGPVELAGQEKLDDKAAMEPGHPGCCDGDVSGPSEALAQTVLADDKVMEWDLVGLDDHLTNDDLWSSMVWDYDQVVVAPGLGHKEESVLSDLFFLDNI